MAAGWTRTWPRADLVDPAVWTYQLTHMSWLSTRVARLEEALSAIGHTRHGPNGRPAGLAHSVRDLNVNCVAGEEERAGGHILLEPEAVHERKVPSPGPVERRHGERKAALPCVFDKLFEGDVGRLIRYGRHV